MDNLEHIVHSLGRISPGKVNLVRVVSFIAHAACMKNYILLCLRANMPHDTPPLKIPESVVSLLSFATELDEEEIVSWWGLLKELAWKEDYLQTLNVSPAKVRRITSCHSGLSAYSFYPPRLHCTTPGCSASEALLPLKKAEITRVVYHTKADGPLPAYNIHWYCRYCRTNYHHNYHVRQGVRTYYDEVSDVIQTGEHQFVERKLISHWISTMLFGWNSATNCAYVYNNEHIQALAAYQKGRHALTLWPCSFKIRHTHIWDAFIVFCLLEDAKEQGLSLQVPHGGLQRDRFLPAMKIRNARLQACGYPEVMHRCDKCTQIIEKDGKISTFTFFHKVSTVVMDGVTVGHPCCGIHNCKEALKSQRDRFCPTHMDQSHVCAIRGCNAPVVPPSRACSDQVHQAAEQQYRSTGKAARQLRQQLRKEAAIIHLEPDAAFEQDDEQYPPATNTPSSLDADPPEPDQVYCVNPSNNTIIDCTPEQVDSDPKIRLRAQFGRRRTHNEQVLVAPCGVIIARTTFYGAEAIGSAAEFFKRVYEHTYQLTGIRPEHMIFDNNCSLAPHVQRDPWWQGIGLTVDVFHFTVKHAKSHHYCQTRCNPTSFPELMDENGKFRVNSSICEQTNNWIGKYLAIAREMNRDLYNFFFDEMFMRKNKFILRILELDGQHPTYWKKGDVLPVPS
ncbi:hypothetical protein BXZ70DRAFT_901892 [Cristinia sonorae]|uniref:CxC5 like cysteine cluster associated with KDZ domain-containing protein n=1 Tax=Cristinia sonorae TaxID=1940300 RepID=A0A8K0UDW9_9AGAR|nr:hypothetical protein BXZ70DRAFT_901892 [Cristinia sonorae]